MSKEEYRAWVGRFVLEHILNIGNTPELRPKEGVPLDTIVITIDVRGVARGDLEGPNQLRDGDEKRTVIVGNMVIDGVTAAERLHGPGYEIVVIQPTDEEP